MKTYKKSMLQVIIILFSCTCLLTSCREKVFVPEGYKQCSSCDGYGKTWLWSECSNCLGKGYTYDFPSQLLKPRQNHDDSEEQDTRTQESPQENPTNSYYGTDYSYPSEDRNPERKPCEACRNTGQCICVRDGHPGKELSAVSLTTDNPVYVTHRYCHGSGQCPACGGDGYLDYGTDY